MSCAFNERRASESVDILLVDQAVSEPEAIMAAPNTPAMYRQNRTASCAQKWQIGVDTARLETPNSNAAAAHTAALRPAPEQQRFMYIASKRAKFGAAIDIAHAGDESA